MSGGLAAEFGGPEALADAAETLQRSGYRRFEAYTPFPIAELERALNCRSERIPWASGIAVLVGAVIILALQWWTFTDYPHDIGGRPSIGWAAITSTTIIVAILWGALGAYAGFLVLAGLPRLRHPIFEAKGFDRLSEGRFFLWIDDADSVFEAEETPALLHRLGALSVESVSA